MKWLPRSMSVPDLRLPSAAEVLSLLHVAERFHMPDIEAVPLNALVMDTARQNDKRPAYIKVYVPDSWTLSLRGDQALQDVFVAVRIPREALDSLRREGTSLGSKAVDPLKHSAPPSEPAEFSLEPPLSEVDDAEC